MEPCLRVVRPSEAPSLPTSSSLIAYALPPGLANNDTTCATRQLLPLIAFDLLACPLKYAPLNLLSTQHRKIAPVAAPWVCGSLRRPHTQACLAQHIPLRALNYNYPETVIFLIPNTCHHSAANHNRHAVGRESGHPAVARDTGGSLRRCDCAHVEVRLGFC